MCGRYYLDGKYLNSNWKKRLNIENKEDIHPSEESYCLISRNNKISLVKVKWGIEFNSKLVINARVETYQEKKMFKDSLPCVVLANGFYAFDNHKRPFTFSKENKQIIYMAGIIKENRLCILTQEASKDIKSIHSRMPILIKQKDVSNWLNSQQLMNEDDELEIQGTYQDSLF